MEFTIIVAMITGLSQFIKKYIPSKFIPVVTIILGILAGIFYLDETLKMRLFLGTAMGLSAMGMFDITKVTTKK